MTQEGKTMDLQVAVSHPDDQAAVVTVVGEIDVVTTPQLRATLHDLAESDLRRVVVDLDGVDFIDSTGLGVLIGCLRRLRSRGEGRDLVLVCNRPNIIRVFTITGLDTMFAVHTSVPDALTA